ncbi:MAG: SigB/SigF/SigG family RNA polymerase sigma factor [Lachnospiraceae bacterium]|nr:SigB/SigF/SigG family RNA polymerase sigma factor [Lachnospiraceae bacterium]
MEDRELFLRAQGGEEAAKEQLFNCNVGLIHHVLKRFMSRANYDMEDLFQIGAIGLLKAIERFDTDFGVCFSTYAVPLILGEIRRFLRDDGLIRVSRGIKENAFHVGRARQRFRQESGREPTLAELSERTGLSVEDIVMALEAGHEVESIYKTMYESDGNELLLLDTIGGTADNDRLMNRLFVEGLLRKLDDRERELIRLRFYENKTQTQTAQRLGMSQVQVSRLEKKILLRLRHAALA